MRAPKVDAAISVPSSGMALWGCEVGWALVCGVLVAVPVRRKRPAEECWECRFIIVESACSCVVASAKAGGLCLSIHSHLSLVAAFRLPQPMHLSSAASVYGGDGSSRAYESSSEQHLISLPSR